MKTALRHLASAAVLLALWQALILATGTPKYILPPPLAVLQKIVSARSQLAEHALVTLAEVGLGLITGTALGILSALALQYSRLLRALLSPLLVSSQAIPVYALAPVLTLWFGFGMLPKILMTVLIIYFPITTAAYAALPAFASGLRVAVAIAPIGAVIGEWVGGSSGLGYLMTYANARTQTDLLFAALAVLVLITLTLYSATDRLLHRLIRWKAAG